MSTKRTEETKLWYNNRREDKHTCLCRRCYATEMKEELEEIIITLMRETKGMGLKITNKKRN